MFVLLAFLTRFAALAACPPPEGPPRGVSADGAAHVLVADAASACWWIVDDAGDPRLGARWDRARREPLLFVPLADGRVAVVLRDPAGGVRLAVRGEGSGERKVLDLPGAPVALAADGARALVALGWTRSGGGRVWLVHVDGGGVAEVWLPAGAPLGRAFEEGRPVRGADGGPGSPPPLPPPGGGTPKPARGPASALTGEASDGPR